MYQRALQEQIDYTLRIAENIKTTAMQSLSEEDFSHLLADLIENAFIAMSDVPDKKFSLTLGEWEITCLLKFPTTDSRFTGNFSGFRIESPRHTPETAEAASGLWTSGNSRKIPRLTGYYGICTRYVLLYEADFTDI